MGSGKNFMRPKLCEDQPLFFVPVLHKTWCNSGFCGDLHNCLSFVVVKEQGTSGISNGNKELLEAVSQTSTSFLYHKYLALLALQISVSPGHLGMERAVFLDQA